MENLEQVADLLDYPSAATLAACSPDAWPDASPVMRGLIDQFARQAQTLPLTQLEEIYAATFDLQPDCTLNLGHQLFGEDHGKHSALLIELAAAAKKAGLDVGTELPDHLCWLLRLMARSPEDAEIQDLAPYCVLPGLRTLTQRVPPDHIYQPLLQALYLLLASHPLGEVAA